MKLCNVFLCLEIRGSEGRSLHLSQNVNRDQTAEERKRMLVTTETKTNKETNLSESSFSSILEKRKKVSEKCQDCTLYTEKKLTFSTQQENTHRRWML